MSTTKTRRQILKATSTAALIGLAGCSTGDTDTDNPTEPTQTTRDKPPKRDEEGYINDETNEIKWDQLENAEDFEYVYAIHEAYNTGQQHLETCYNSIDGVFTALKEPDFETANQNYDQAINAVKTADKMHTHCLTLLHKIDEPEAIDAVETNQAVVKDTQAFITNKLQEFLNKYEAGDRGYVSEHDTEYYNQFEELKNRNHYWPYIEGKLEILEPY